MKVEIKTWAALGLAGALAGSGIAGCSDEAPETEGDTDRVAAGLQPGPEGEGGEGGEAGEGGESGEGGIDAAAAARDPVAYLTALAVAEAHAIAAWEAYLAGKTDPAAEMFGHPVTEVLAEMEPVLTERGVADLAPRFNEASQAVLDGRSEIEVGERYGAVIAALERAEENAPETGVDGAQVASRVVADLIERAAAMYREAQSSRRYEPYLDGYGFYRAAASAFEDAEPAILAARPDLAARIREALELLAAAYPGAERPETLDGEPGKLIAAGSRIALALDSAAQQ
ncbi:MAG: hypothetical protein RIB52_05830 [Erythrobacter sp.]|uniref:hypothetical protein n=1 Tax=Erythrobacter sp. TaxID=1042 RepID=UPI0032EB63BD